MFYRLKGRQCIDTVLPVAVDKTASIRFDTNQYSVPPEYACKTLTLVASDLTLRVLAGDQIVAEHRRCWGKKQRIERTEHRAALLEAKRGARELKGRDRLRVDVPRIDELLERWMDDGRNMGSRTASTVKLLELYGGRILNEAVVELLERGQHDLGALSILCEQRRTRRPVAMPIELGAHVPERDVIPHDLGDYDE